VSKKPKLSSETDQWLEIFQNLNLDVIPIKYLHSVRVIFKDGKIWDIDVANSKKKEKNKDIEDSLLTLFDSYEEEIQNIDFRLDTEKIKKDILKSTANLLKKKK